MTEGSVAMSGEGSQGKSLDIDQLTNALDKEPGAEEPRLARETASKMLMFSMTVHEDLMAVLRDGLIDMHMLHNMGIMSVHHVGAEPNVLYELVGEATSSISFVQRKIRKEYDKAPRKTNAQGNGQVRAAQIAGELYDLGATLYNALKQGLKHLEDYNEIDEDTRGDLQKALKVLHMIAKSIPAACE